MDRDEPWGANAEDDALDAAATAQRPALTVRSGSRRVARRQPTADTTSEVQVEDILLEAYAEEPPPPSRRAAPPTAQASIAMAIASVVPPAPVESAAVDALLRASDPAFAPFVPQPAPSAFPAYAVHAAHAQHAQHRIDYDTPSLSPVMVASAAPPARPVLAAKSPNRALVAAIWSIVLLVVGVAVGGVVAMGVHNGSYARLRDGAKAAAARAGAKHAAPVAAGPVAPAPVAAGPSVAQPSPVVVAPAPTVAPALAPAIVPASVSVDSLPKSSPVAPDMSLVTFPAYAQGHRVFVDGRVIAVAVGAPTKIKCGRHLVKIGSTRKARDIDLACGREVILD